MKYNWENEILALSARKIGWMSALTLRALTIPPMACLPMKRAITLSRAGKPWPPSISCP